MTKKGDTYVYNEAAAWIKGPWTVSSNLDLNLNNFTANYFSAKAAWADNDSEISVAT